MVSGGGGVGTEGVGEKGEGMEEEGQVGKLYVFLLYTLQVFWPIRSETKPLPRARTASG